MGMGRLLGGRDGFGDGFSDGFGCDWSANKNNPTRKNEAGATKMKNANAELDQWHGRLHQTL